MLFFILFNVVLLFFILREKEGPVVLVFSNIGAGKTTLLARYAQKEIKRINNKKSKYKYVISNTPISGCIYVPDIRKFLRQYAPENCLILVDEGGIVWNNRKMRITDEEIEYIKLIRHYNSKIVVVSQSHEDVDITLRRLYTNIYLLNRIGGITLIRPIRKFVSIDDETQQIIDGYRFRSVFSWGLLLRRKYYKYFDTNWKPSGRVNPEEILRSAGKVPYRVLKKVA